MKTIFSILAMSAALASDLGAQAAQQLSISPAHPAPGAIVRISLRDPGQAESIIAITGTLAHEALHFLPAGNGVWHAIGGLPVDAEGSVVATAIVVRPHGISDTVRARVTLPKIPPPTAQPLSVDGRFTRPLDAATTARIERENERAREIGRQAHESVPMWTAPFLRPRTSVVTSEFGSGRLFNGRLTTRHLGVDFRGAVGQPVLAANRGVVALVDNFFLAGTVIYIDHGAGVVTGYFHLSKTLVQAGDTVSRGQQIGLVGNTGRVTGPHLHWSARYGAITVNPLDLIGLGGEWYSAANLPR